MTMMSTTTKTMADLDKHDYRPFLRKVQDEFDRVTQDLQNSQRLFMTGVPRDLLMTTFLAGLPAELRQEYTCNCCRQFLSQFGSIVRVGDSGEIQSVLWSNPAWFPPIYRQAIRDMKNQVEQHAIEDVVMVDKRVLGTPVTGDWEHMHVLVPQHLLTRRRGTLQLSQMQAEKREDTRMLRRLLEYQISEVAAVHTLLSSDKLYRAGRHVEWAAWLLDVRKQLDKIRDLRARDRYLWLKASEAPQGWCHLGSSMVGLLLQGVKEGKTGQELANLYSQLMDPLQYRRPSAAPKSGAIDRAEKLVQELGLARSFERRFAQLDDCQKLWWPKEQEVTGGVFGHLRKKVYDSPKVQLTESSTITWSRFRRTVLPTALEIQLVKQAHGYVFTAPVHPDSPNLLQWDNSVSWYTRVGGLVASELTVRPGRVRAVILFPFMWEHEDWHQHQGRGVLFAVEGAQDHGPNSSSALFPEHLRSEFHEIRSVVEAHSRSSRVQGSQEGAVIGPAVREGNTAGPVTLDVRTEGGVNRYVIDRWD